MGAYDDILTGKTGGAYDDILNPPAPSLARRAVDTIGIPLAKGIIGVPEFATGLADIATGGAAGKALESAGVRFKDAKGALDEMLSPHQQALDQGLRDTKGFFPTAGYMLSNPSTILSAAVESAPSMLGGAAIGRGALAAGQGALARTVGEKVAPIVAGAAGEGLVGAGSSAEQIRQQDPSGMLSGQQAALAAGSGALTGLIGGAGGALARRMGLTDIDTALVAGKMAGSGKGVAARVAGGAVSEGLLEELPQSAQEQVAQNLALGRPWDEGVPEAAAMGALVGGVMGGGANLLAGKQTPATKDGGLPADASATAGVRPDSTTPDFTAERTAVVQAALDPNAGSIAVAAGIGELNGLNDQMRAQKMAAAAEEAAQMAAKGKQGEAKSKGGTLAQDAQATNDAEEQAQMAGRTPRTAGASLGASGELSAMQMALQQARPLGQTQAESRVGADAPPNQQAIPTAPASLAPAAPATPDNVISPADQTVQPSATPSLGTVSPVRPASSAPGTVAVDQSATGTPAASRKKSAPTPLPVPSPSDRQSTTESVSTQSPEAASPSPQEVTPNILPPTQGGAGPRVFYRGTEPGRTDRIKTGNSAWDSYLFASSTEDGARPYGKQIETITAKPEAKILYEGSQAFRSVGKGLKPQGMSMLAWSSEIAKRAKDAGYDAVHFKRQSDIGTAILNPSVFVRGPQGSQQENANVQAAPQQVSGEGVRPLAVAQGTSGDSAVRPAVSSRPNADAGVSGTATPDLRSDAVRGDVPAGAAKTDTTVDSAAGVTDEKGAVDTAAHQSAASPKNDLPEPTAAQREAGNFKMGHASVAGLPLTIEHPVGSSRKEGWQKLKSHYGYIKRSVGADSENFDVFVKPGTPEDYSGPVFVVDQQDKSGKFDEHKGLIGWPDKDAATKGYAENYPVGFKVGPVTQMAADDFKAWLATGDTKAPLSTAPPQPANAVAETPAAKSPDSVSRFIPDLNKAASGGASDATVKAVSKLRDRIKAIDGNKTMGTPGRKMTTMDAAFFIAEYRKADPAVKPVAKQLAEHAIAQFPDAKLSLLTRQEQKAAADAEKKAANVAKMRERREAAKQAKAPKATPPITPLMDIPQAERILRLIDSRSQVELNRLAVRLGLGNAQTDAGTIINRLRKAANEAIGAAKKPTSPAPSKKAEADEPAEKPERKRTPRQQANDARLRRNAEANKKVWPDTDTLLEAVIKEGGILQSYRRDITGDTKGSNPKIPYVGSLFGKNGLGVDVMAQRLSQSGYDYIPREVMETADGGVQWLKDKIVEAIAGHPTYSAHYDIDEAMRKAQDDAMAAAAGDLTSEDVAAVVAENPEVPADQIVDAFNADAALQDAGITDPVTRQAIMDAAAYAEMDQGVSYEEAINQAITEHQQGNGVDQQAASDESPALELTGQTNTEVLAAEKAQAQAEADAAKEPASTGQKVKADQVDMFNTQGGIFDQPPPKDALEALGNRGDMWYSALSRKIADLKLPQAPAPQWAMTINAMTQKGVTKAEIEAVGILDWLQLQQGKVSKQAVQDYLDANGVQVTETTLGEDPIAPLQARIDAINDRYNAIVDEYGVPVQSLPAKAKAEIDALTKEHDELADRVAGVDPRYSEPKFASYQLPGGTAYKELLLTLPQKGGGARKAELDRIMEQERPLTAAEESEYDGFMRERDGFRSSHFDQPNILAHIRFNERTDADGKKVLFIEEIQSDFGQQTKRQRDAVAKAVDGDFLGIIARMEKAGVLTKECD